MKLFRSLSPEIKVIDAARGVVDYVASDETVDCYREVIRAAGWKFTHFAKNAPFVDSHDYSTVEKMLGKVIDFRVEGRQLVERVQWAVDVPEAKLAQLGFKLTEGGYLKAVSVGFFPLSMASKFGDAGRFAQAAQELGLTPAQLAAVECIHVEQEQIELSACVIGANPNALAKAHDDGLVRDSELDALNFTDEDMDGLHALATAFPSMSPAMQRFADLALAGIPFRKTTKQQPATPADGLDAAGEAERREQAEWLRKFTAATN